LSNGTLRPAKNARVYFRRCLILKPQKQEASHWKAREPVPEIRYMWATHLPHPDMHPPALAYFPHLSEMPTYIFR
jgi:hypothetical protein